MPTWERFSRLGFGAAGEAGHEFRILLSLTRHEPTPVAIDVHRKPVKLAGLGISALLAAITLVHHCFVSFAMADPSLSYTPVVHCMYASIRPALRAGRLSSRARRRRTSAISSSTTPGVT